MGYSLRNLIEQQLPVYLLFGGVYFEQCYQKNMLGNTRASAMNAW